MRRAAGRRVWTDGCQAIRELPALAAARRGAGSRQRAEAETLDDGLTAGERVSQRAAIDVLELAANGDAVRDPAGPQPSPGGELRQKMRRGLSLDGRVGCENQLVDRALLEVGLELTDAQLLRAHAIER